MATDIKKRISADAIPNPMNQLLSSVANRLHIHQRDDLPPVPLVVQRWKPEHRTPLKLSRCYTSTVWTTLLYSKTPDDQLQFSFVPSSGPHTELTTYSSPSLLGFSQNVDSMPFAVCRPWSLLGKRWVPCSSATVRPSSISAANELMQI
ncbi:hypothetical protein DFH09DRAFT_1113888 [Mycena vulgaris]|nr:hypothetical protein DFH09DRAFT_1113888 [Mycena vulgaris]